MYGLSQTPILNNSNNLDKKNKNICLVLGFFENTPLPAFAQSWELEPICNQLNTRGESLWHFHNEQAILILHCGDKKALSLTHVAKLSQTAYTALNQQKINATTVCIPQAHNATPNQQACHTTTLPHRSPDATYYTLTAFKFYLYQ